MKHLQKIPFQNVEGVRRGRRYFDFKNPNSLLEPVLQGVGGVCFHLNYSFHLLLQEMGFKCYLISCRLYESDFDHMAIAVKEDGQLKLVDVGMGTHYLTKPMPIKDGHIHQDVSGSFRVRKVEDRFVVERWRRRKWVYIYKFLLTPRKPEEFEYMVDRHYRFDSGLRDNVICSRWVNNKLFARLYNKKLTLYCGENSVNIKMEGLSMENVLKLNWINEVLLMLMGSSDNNNDQNDDSKGGTKTSPCGCSNPDLVYEEANGFFGTTTILKCKNCGWGSASTR